MLRLRQILAYLILSFYLLVTFQNCAFSDNDTTPLSARQTELANELQAANDRSSNLDIVLRGLIDEERAQRIAADNDLNTKIEQLGSDLLQFKSETNTSITELQKDTSNLKTELTSAKSDLNKRVSDAESKAVEIQQDYNQKFLTFDAGLRQSLREQVSYLESKLETARDSILALINDNQNLNQTKMDELKLGVINNTQNILNLAQDHERFKALVSITYATKEDLNALRTVYEDLNTVIANLNTKLNLTAEQITAQLGGRLEDLKTKIDQVQVKVDSQQQQINQVRADLLAAIQTYKYEIKNLSDSTKEHIQDTKKQMIFAIGQSNANLRTELLAELQKKSLELTLYTNKAFNILAERILNLENEMSRIKDKSDSRYLELQASIKDARDTMSQALAEEQAARKEVMEKVQELSLYVQRIEKDLIETQALARDNLEVMRKLRFDFEQEKTAVSDRFKAERIETTKQLDLISEKFQKDLQQLSDKTEQMTRDLGDDIRLQLRAVVTDIAVLNSRTASVESSVKSALEEIQNNRAKTFKFESDLVVPRQKNTQALLSAIRALGDIQIRFVKILNPDEKVTEFYNEEFKPLMRTCGGDQEASFPNALGYDSFQILAMEYTRSLLLGERTGNDNIDQIFHGFGEAVESGGLSKTLLLNLIRYPIGSESEFCLSKIQNFGKAIILNDPRFQPVRERLAASDELARNVENIYDALVNMQVPANQIDDLIAASLSGLKNYDQLLTAMRVKTSNDLLEHAQSSIALAERSQILQEFADFHVQTSQDREASTRQINEIKSQLNEFKATTNQRINQLQSDVGNIKLTVKRALDVLISLADRGGYPDLKAYTVWAGVPINAVPEVVPFWRPQVRQVQHFFSGPLSLKNKSDACSGVKIDEFGGANQGITQFGKWGPCWVNFRAFPQKAWGNEVKTIWLRVFGSATQINVKVDPRVQLEQQALFAGYNYDKTFDFRNLDPNDRFLRLNGTFNRGVFDIRVPDILDYYCERIRTWSGIALTVTPIKTDTYGGVQAGGGTTSVENGSSFIYRIQIFSPLVIDFKKHGTLQTVSQNDSGVQFDLMGNGTKVKTGWVKSDQGALLALDLNKNGVIDNGLELFGEATVMPNGSKASNGFVALGVYDTNKDGVINNKDAIYNELLIWADHNQNGISEKDELTSFAESNVQVINLLYTEVAKEKRMNSGNDLRYMSISDVKVYDVYFGYTVQKEK
jgi:hypothetical protein